MSEEPRPAPKVSDALRGLGKQFRETERREHLERDLTATGVPGRGPSRWHVRSRRRRLLGVLVGLVGAAAAVFELVAPAGASSPVSRAPLAAERAGTVRFSSQCTGWLNGNVVARFSDVGRVDFASQDYEATLVTSTRAKPVVRRKVGRTIYFRALAAPRHAEAGRWYAVRATSEVGGAQSASLVTMIDPQVVLRVLARTRARPITVGPETLGGVATVRYRVATSLGDFGAAERAPGEPHSVNAVKGRLDVWLDDAGRPRKVAASFWSNPRVAALDVSLSFSGYGQAVVVTAPSRVAPARRSGALPSSLLRNDPVRVLERVLFERRSLLSLGGR